MGGPARLVGLTTTIPVEAVFAAGFRPLDLNNLFVSHPRREMLLDAALKAGFPQSSCAWTRGIFGAVVELGEPDMVIGVVRGDCSGTEVLLEALASRGVEVIPFSYPYPPDEEDLEREVSRLCETLGTTMSDAARWLEVLSRPRASLREVDRLCWREDRVTGLENHLWLVSSSDFAGDPARFGGSLESFLAEARRREPLSGRVGIPFAREVRLGYLGVPPISTEIFTAAEAAGGRFVFHEVQRQFSMTAFEPTGRAGTEGAHETEALIGQYLSYTYPYTIAGRVEDINSEARLRRLDGLVHYVQSFCHRNMEDVVFKTGLELPLLTVECDCPGELTAPVLSRLENFIQVLGENLG